MRVGGNNWKEAGGWDGSGGEGKELRKTQRLEIHRRNSRLPLNRGGGGVSFGLAGEHHVGSTHVPVVVVAHDSHLRGIWREKKSIDGGIERMRGIMN